MLLIERQPELSLLNVIIFFILSGLALYSGSLLGFCILLGFWMVSVWDFLQAVEETLHAYLN